MPPNESTGRRNGDRPAAQDYKLTCAQPERTGITLDTRSTGPQQSGTRLEAPSNRDSQDFPSLLDTTKIASISLVRAPLSSAVSSLSERLPVHSRCRMH